MKRAVQHVIRQASRRQLSRAFLWGLAFAAALCVAQSAPAQSAPSAAAPNAPAALASHGIVFQGTIHSASIPLPGVTVVLRDRAGHGYTTATDSNGHFSLLLPAPGPYQLSTELLGFAPLAQPVTVGAAPAALRLNLRLATAGGAGGNTALADLLSGGLGGGGTPSAGASYAGAGFAGAGEAGGMSAMLSGAVNATTPGAAESGTAIAGMSDDAATETVAVSGNLGSSDSNPNDFRPEREGGPGEGRGFGGPGEGRGFGGGFGGPGAFRGGPGRGRRLARFNPNTYHGSIFETAGNSAFDARPFALSGGAAPKPAFSSNRLGAVGGGPLVIPHVFDDHGKTFFFGGFFLNNSTNPYDVYSTVPTLAERSGDFQGLTDNRGNPIVLYDPETHAPFANNTIPTARLDNAAQQLLNYLPQPNLPGTTRNFHLLSTTGNNNHTLFARLIHNFASSSSAGPRSGNVPFFLARSSISLGFRYSGGSSDNLTPFPAMRGTSTSRNFSTDFGWTMNRNGWILLSRLNYSRSRMATTNLYAFHTDVAAQLGVAGVSTVPFDWGVPAIALTHFTGLNDVTPALDRNQTYQWSETEMHRAGRHQWRLGGEARRMLISPESNANARGNFTFSGLYTSNNGAPGSGYDFADFLLGLAQQTSVRYAGGPDYFSGYEWSLFAMDNWQARHNLTLNLGLRYEYVTPMTEKYGRLTNLDVAPGFAAVVPVTPGQTSPYSGVESQALIDHYDLGFEPRLGLAWQPMRSTVVRAGYGINLNTSAYRQLINDLAFEPPFAVTNNLSGTPGAPLTLENGFPTSSVVTDSYGVDRRFQPGYVQTWNLNVQRTLPFQTVLNLDYTGTKGTNLEIVRAPNRLPGGGLRLAGVAPFLWESSEGNSILHSGSLSLRKRLSHGFSVGGTYVYAKSIDDASSIAGAAATVAQNDLNLAAERGLSAFDQRQRLNLYYEYELPFGENKPWLAGGGKLAALVGGWRWSGNITAADGTPYSATVLGSFAAVAQGANGSLRANATGASSTLAAPTAAQFFNPAAFSLPAPGSFGDAGRNTIVGPGQLDFNMQLGREIQIGEAHSLNLRLEANNVFNHAQWAAINSVVNSPGFGQVTSVRSMRTVQVQLRFRY